MPETDLNTVAGNETYINADTCCLGNNFIPSSYTKLLADFYLIMTHKISR